MIAGLTNTYSSYITTREEYAAQRYEAASTIFGPSTLDAYIQANHSNAQRYCHSYAIHAIELKTW